MMNKQRKYYDIMAMARTKLYTAVSLPAILGASYSYIHGHFSFARFSLLFIGFIFSELLYLLIYDYKILDTKKQSSNRIILPGNPVFSPISLPRKKLPQLLGVSFVGWGIVLLFFLVQLGSFIAVLMSGILLLCLLRLIDRLFPLNILNSALPPLLSFTVFFALSGEPDINAFIIGLPLVWVTAAILLLNLGLYSAKDNAVGRYYMPSIFLFFISFVNIVYFVSQDTYSPISLLSVIIYIIAIMKLTKLSKTEREDSIPAISIGYMIHASVLIILIISIILL